MRADWASRVNWLLNRIAQEAATAVDRDLPVSIKRKTVDLALDLKDQLHALLLEAGVELAAQAAEESAKGRPPHGLDGLLPHGTESTPLN